MHIEWTNHLKDPIEKQQFEASYHGSETVLNRLVELIDDKLGAIDRSAEGLKQYQHPNWAVETAHKNGMVSAYKAVKELVTIKDEQ